MKRHISLFLTLVLLLFTVSIQGVNSQDVAASYFSEDFTDYGSFDKFTSDSSGITGAVDGTPFKANMANNSFTYHNGEKVYGGIDGFYGYSSARNNSAMKAWDTDCSVINYVDGALQLAPQGSSGHSSFGKYGLNLNGYSVFETNIALYNASFGTVKLQLTDGKAVESDECNGYFDILTIDKECNIYFAGGGQSIGSITPIPLNDWSTNGYLNIKYILDNTSDTVKHSVKITRNSDNTVVKEVSLSNLDTSKISGSFSFDSTKLGFRVYAESSLFVTDRKNKRVFVDNIFFTNKSVAKTAVVNVNEEKVINRVNRRYFGANYEWGGEEHLYLKSGLCETNPKFVECFSGYAPFNRMAGTSANNFYWKKAIGDLSQREEQTIWSTTKKMRFGPVEWINTVKSADPNSEFIYTININDTIENTADLVEFLTGNGTDNPNGGENWAAKRTEYGIANPVDVYAWEIGNEMDYLELTAEEYITVAKTHIDAIRSVDADAKIAVHASTDATKKQSGWTEWHRAVLTALGEEINFVSVHYYYPTNGNLSVGLDAIKTINNDIQSITGRSDIKILITENASNRISSDSSTGKQWSFPHTMGGTLNSARFYIEVMKLPYVAATAYHSINSSSWALCYPTSSGDILPTAVYSMQKLFMNFMCGDILQTDISVQSCVGDADVAVAKTEDGLNVLFVNRNVEETIQASFNLSKKYRVTASHTISAESYYADNYTNINEISIADSNAASGEWLTKYSFPKLSITVLELKTINSTDFEEKFLASDYAFTYDLAAQTDNMPEGMSVNDIVGVNTDIPYNGSPAENMYTWMKKEDGTYEKIKCGFEGYFGYYNNLDGKDILNKNSIEFLSVTNLSEKGSENDKVLRMNATGDSGYPIYTCFGRDDLDLSGRNTFKFKIGTVTASPGNVDISIVQGRNGDTKDFLGSYSILKLDKDGKVYCFGSETPSLVTVKPTLFSSYNKNNFITVQYILDNSGARPKHSLEIFDKDNNLIHYSPLCEVDIAEDESFTFLNAIGGFNINVSPTSWQSNRGLLIDEISFSKTISNIENRVIVSDQRTISTPFVVICAHYNLNNALKYVDVFDVDKRISSFCCQNSDNEGYKKLFVWKGLTDITPIPFNSSNDFGSEILELE